MDLICNDMIPKVAKQGIAKFNDVFCEPGYFDIEQSKRILQTGKNHGLIPRMHCDEFSNFGASILAAELEVQSADHLMEIDEGGVDALAKKKDHKHTLTRDYILSWQKKVCTIFKITKTWGGGSNSHGL